MKRLLLLSLDKEIIVVDDGSTDGTSEKINRFLSIIKILRHETNQGKGVALRTGLAHAAGDFIFFCDADLECDIDQVSTLFDCISQNGADVVYGSRFIDYQPRKKIIHYLGNRFLTWLTDCLFDAKLTDMETAYKMFRSNVVKNMVLTSRRFEIEPEITAKILKQGIEIRETPIAYDPRVKSEGKKIKYRDGLMAVKVLIREKITRAK
ncbi:glycosyltransferase family 2 protein [Patescibacteria group bacterium]|nr:glycosyltransferase family 2 protein [Patescibacteria group bacterium]